MTLYEDASKIFYLKNDEFNFGHIYQSSASFHHEKTCSNLSKWYSKLHFSMVSKSSK
jgi:hypothetical protein